MAWDASSGPVINGGVTAQNAIRANRDPAMSHHRVARDQGGVGALESGSGAGREGRRSVAGEAGMASKLAISSRMRQADPRRGAGAGPPFGPSGPASLRFAAVSGFLRDYLTV